MGKEEIPELYIALRNQLGAKAGSKIIEEAYNDHVKDTINYFFRKEDVERWERILNE